jgi:type VI secretion system ImpH/TssG family protein
MADADWTEAQHLKMLAKVAEAPRSYGVFPVLRAAEARGSDFPRIGKAKLPERNLVDLAQLPHLGFADATLTAIKISGARARVEGTWLGLTGPMGALPTHLTEFAFYERRYGKSRPFGDWLDLLAGRMLQLFYRSWADSQPAALADRPDDDSFAGWVAAISGAHEGAATAISFPRSLRAHYASVFAGSRSATAIEDAMSHLLRQDVRVLEFQGRWRALEPEDLTRLGRSFAQIGSDAMLGRRARSASDAFRVVIRAASYRDYISLLPTGPRFAIAAEALDAFKPSHLEWDITLEIDELEAPPCRLDGRTQLGWSSWVKPRGAHGLPGQVVRGDAHLRRMKSRKRGIPL